MVGFKTFLARSLFPSSKATKATRANAAAPLALGVLSSVIGVPRGGGKTAGLQNEEGKRLRPHSYIFNIFNLHQTVTSGCPGGAKAKPCPPWVSCPSFKAKIQVPVSKMASKGASGCPGGTKVKSWPPWTSWPLIKAIQDPENSGPRFTTLSIERRKNPLSGTIPFSSKACQFQTIQKMASKTAPGCPRGG